MPLSMYQACVPVCLQMLGALSGVLDKAAAHAQARKIDPAVLLTARLYPDMFTLTKQVQIACDFARWSALRPAGLEVERVADTETSFDELKARIGKTMDQLKAIRPEQLDGTEERTVEFKAGTKEFRFTGQQYLLHVALPNVFFHITTAYAILRHNGVELGKMDYMGATG